MDCPLCGQGDSTNNSLATKRNIPIQLSLSITPVGTVSTTASITSQGQFVTRNLYPRQLGIQKF